MPIYSYKCDKCDIEIEKLQPMNGETLLCPNCGEAMAKKPSLPAIVRIKGLGYPSRRKWADNWTPDSPPFKTGSLHGEQY
jgi:putative FmdB family regulatory protein